MMFVTDFDGTLADDNSFVSENSISELNRIGKLGVIRVVATGRSLFSLKTVVNDDFPIDYLVFSSGIGVYDWKQKKLLQENIIDSENTKLIYDYLVSNDYDFMVQLPVPNNHFFHHFSSGRSNADFFSRINHYETKGIDSILDCPRTASQFVIICADEAQHFEIISSKFCDLKVVRATSPLDKKSVWIEILPKNTSKASGMEFLRNLHNLDIENLISVGNDYYDLDMLNYTLRKNSYVVANSPKELRSEFNIIDSNLNDGVAKLLQILY
jgi:HAD superfamily hydrolase (TIGR01484 family)